MSIPGFNPPGQTPPLSDEEKQRKKEQDLWNARVLGDLYSKTAVFKKERWHRIGEPVEGDNDVALVALDDVLLEPGIYKYTKHAEEEAKRSFTNPNRETIEYGGWKFNYRNREAPAFNINLDKNGTVTAIPANYDPVQTIAVMDFLGAQGVKNIQVKLSSDDDGDKTLQSHKKRKLQTMINHAAENGFSLDLEDCKDFIATLKPHEQERFLEAEKLLKVKQHQAKLMTGELFVSALETMITKTDNAGGLGLQAKSGDANSKRQDVLNQTGTPPTLDGIETQITNMKKRVGELKANEFKVSASIESQHYIMDKPETMSKAASMKYFRYNKSINEATKKFMQSKNERYQDPINVLTDLKQDHDKTKLEMQKAIEALDREVDDLDHRKEILEAQLQTMKAVVPAPPAADITKIDNMIKELDKVKDDLVSEKNKITAAKTNHADMDNRFDQVVKKERTLQANRKP